MHTHATLTDKRAVLAACTLVHSRIKVLSLLVSCPFSLPFLMSKRPRTERSSGLCVKSVLHGVRLALRGRARPLEAALRAHAKLQQVGTRLHAKVGRVPLDLSEGHS